MRFGDIIQKLLHENGLSQKELADHLNVAPSTVGNYVQNIREPDFATLVQIADYFEVSVDYLLDHHARSGLNSSEAEIIRVFRSIPNDYKKFYIEQGKVLLNPDLRKAGEIKRIKS